MWCRLWRCSAGAAQPACIGFPVGPDRWWKSSHALMSSPETLLFLGKCSFFSEGCWSSRTTSMPREQYQKNSLGVKMTLEWFYNQRLSSECGWTCALWSRGRYHQVFPGCRGYRVYKNGSQYLVEIAEQHLICAWVLGSLTTRSKGTFQGHLGGMADQWRHFWVHHWGGREELVPANHHRTEVQLLQQDSSYTHKAFAVHSSVVSPNDQLQEDIRYIWSDLSELQPQISRVLLGYQELWGDRVFLYLYGPAYKYLSWGGVGCDAAWSGKW